MGSVVGKGVEGSGGSGDCGSAGSRGGPWAALLALHAAPPLSLEAKPAPPPPERELWGAGFTGCSSTGSAGPGVPREPGQSWWLHPWGVWELDSRRPKVQVSHPGARALGPGASPVPQLSPDGLVEAS